MPAASSDGRRGRWRALVPLILGLLIALLPIPPGLSVNAWYYFALFVAVIVALITDPLPGAAVGLIGITTASALLLVAPRPADSIRWALTGFADGTVWLMFVYLAVLLGLGLPYLTMLYP